MISLLCCLDQHEIYLFYLLLIVLKLWIPVINYKSLVPIIDPVILVSYAILTGNISWHFRSSLNFIWRSSQITTSKLINLLALGYSHLVHVYSMPRIYKESGLSTGGRSKEFCILKSYFPATNFSTEGNSFSKDKWSWVITTIFFLQPKLIGERIVLTDDKIAHGV